MQYIFNSFYASIQKKSRRSGLRHNLVFGTTCGQIVGERGVTAFPFRFWRGNAVPLAYTTAVGGHRKKLFKLFVDNGGRRLPDGLKALHCAVNTLVVSTADCERAFSCTNETLTATRNTLAVDILSSLMFLSVCGPPTSQFKPEQYVKSWLCKHVSADDTKSRARSAE